MITIGIDASRANRSEKTGVEWYSYHLIQEMKKLIPPDYRVILYSAETLRGALAKLPSNWESRILSGLKLPFAKKAWLWTQIGLTLEMLFHKPDILFVPSHAIPLIHPKRTYTTIHDIGFEVFPESYGFLARLYHRWSARFALRHADRVFTPSEFTKQELIRYYKANPDKIIVTPLGFDASLYHPRQGEEIKTVLQKYNLPLSQRGIEGDFLPYILFIGRVEKKKNVARLIEAFLELKKETPSPLAGEGGERGNPENIPQSEICNLKLVIVGSPGYGFEDIKATAANSNDIIFTGWLPEDGLPRILRGAALYALPSLYEGFGIPILEAMASGVPVLTSNTASMPEVAGEAACLVNPEDISAIKSGLQKILTDESYRRGLIFAGSNRVRGFAWKNTAEKTLNSIINAD